MVTKQASAAARTPKARRATAASLAAALSLLGCHATRPTPAPSAGGAVSSPSSTAELFRDLPARFETLDGTAELERWAKAAEQTPGVARVERPGAGSCRMVLDPPLSAKKLAHWLGLAHAFVVSDGAGGRAWHLVGNPRRGPGGRGYRHMQASVLVFGDWRVDVRVDGRPEGPLPNALSDGEPAYSLREYDAKVTTINIDSTR